MTTQIRASNVMLRQLAGVCAATLFIVGCMLLPFLPGVYDSLAVTLSMMSQLFAVAGLVLVPIGAIWLARELGIGRGPGTAQATGPRRGHALVALIAATLVAIVVSLRAFTTAAYSFGFAVLMLWTYCAARLVVRVRRTDQEHRRFNPAPLYLLILPVVATIARTAAVGPASDFARNRAIENSARLISDIERYRDTNGRYPQSLASLRKDYRPSVIGISQYHYEPNGEAYNVFFEPMSHDLSTREIVMYNKRDEHAMGSHDMDLLTSRSGGRGGYYAVQDASTPHWKRFLFD